MVPQMLSDLMPPVLRQRIHKTRDECVVGRGSTVVSNALELPTARKVTQLIQEVVDWAVARDPAHAPPKPIDYFQVFDSPQARR
jgi:hypothetical protein